MADDFKREIPTKKEQEASKKTFIGRERSIPWSVKSLETGQFISFTYNGKKRRVLVLSPKWISTKNNKVLTAIEINDIVFNPGKLTQIFNVTSAPRRLRIAKTDDDGFRFFQVNFDMSYLNLMTTPNKLYKLLRNKNKVLSDNYKTYYLDKLKTGVIKMFNPILPEGIVTKFNIDEIE
tara:strand:- start:4879 stop:5412 length:534 start_codon:yes stop_codon:yes gene_type:complete